MYLAASLSSRLRYGILVGVSGKTGCKRIEQTASRVVRRMERKPQTRRRSSINESKFSNGLVPTKISKLQSALGGRQAKEGCGKT